jgi:hypothetical protein
MLKQFLTCLLLLSPLSLVAYVQDGLFSSNEGIPKSDAIVHEIMDETFELLGKKYKINPAGMGINGHFEYLELTFQLFDVLTQDQLREMLFDCSEVFLEKINSNEKVKPFLKDVPFTQKNIGIVFFIRDENNQDVSDPNFCCVSVRRGDFQFSTKTRENRYQYKNSIEETYEQAFSKIAQSRNLTPAEEKKPSPK